MAYGTCERGWISNDFAAGDHGGGTTLTRTCPLVDACHRNNMETIKSTTDERIPQVRDGCAQRPCGEFS